jgi:AcrR family transcriptional regulator
VGVDEIAARTHLTKRTLYAHFRSKDDLLAATLARYSELDRQRAADDRRTATGRGSGDDRVSVSAKWSNGPASRAGPVSDLHASSSNSLIFKGATVLA